MTYRDGLLRCVAWMERAEAREAAGVISDGDRTSLTISRTWLDITRKALAAGVFDADDEMGSAASEESP
jgi:hypothetical protein